MLFCLKCYPEFREDTKNLLLSDFKCMYKYTSKNIAFSLWIPELISDIDIQSPYSLVRAQSKPIF